MKNVSYFEGNATLRIGRIRVTTLLDGWLSLDGGAMYGIVPKTLWEQQLPADSKNRVRMAMRPLLVQTPTNTVVIESGIGQAVAPQLYERYGIDRTGPLLGELVRAAGVEPDTVDTVACTHLHWDHSGGLCRLQNGAYEPTFAKATYVAQRGEWEIATHPDNLHKASYTPASLQPIEQRGQLRLVQGDAQIAPGLRFEFNGGHTENHAVIWIEDQGQAACFLGDLVPTASHVPMSWISAYDIHAGGSFHAREALYPKLVAAGATCLFYHEPEYPARPIVQNGHKYSAPDIR